MESTMSSSCADLCKDGRNVTPRSILKKSPSVGSSEKAALEMNEGEDGNGVIVPRYFSPYSTPSAGILKKRRYLFGETTVNLQDGLNSPSPRTARRRVHFSTTDISYLSTSDEEDEHFRSTPRKKLRPNANYGAPAASFANRFLIRTIRMVQQTNKTLGDLDGKEFTATDSSPPAVGYIQSNKESDTNSDDPIFPPLVRCTQSLEPIIAQISPTGSYRSLAMFLKGRNINTIGQLAALTELQVHQLPVKQPKIKTMRKALALLEKDCAVSEGEKSLEKSNESNGQDAADVVTPEETSHHGCADTSTSNELPLSDTDSVEKSIESTLLSTLACFVSPITDDNEYNGVPEVISPAASADTSNETQLPDAECVDNSDGTQRSEDDCLSPIAESNELDDRNVAELVTPAASEQHDEADESEEIQLSDADHVDKSDGSSLSDSDGRLSPVMLVSQDNSSQTGDTIKHKVDSPILISQDVGSQTDDAASFKHLSLRELRLLSQNLLASLAAVFDRISELE